MFMDDLLTQSPFNSTAETTRHFQGYGSSYQKPTLWAASDVSYP